jgi:hypothetical protein
MMIFLKLIKKYTSFLVLVLIALGLPLGANLVNQKITINSLANSTPAVISISPQNITLPPAVVLDVMVDPANETLVFSSVEINFDPTVLRLTDIPTVNATLDRLISSTAIDQANITGKLVVAAGVDPADSGKSSLFTFLKLPFASITSQSVATSVWINTESQDTKLINSDAAQIALTAMPSTIVLNPTPIISPTVTTVPSEASCQSICKSRNFLQGVCRPNAQHCVKNSETNVFAGDTFCGPGNKSCCCL